MSAIFPTIISTCIASLVAYGVAYFRARYDERKAIHDMIAKMLELAMAYPHVESDEFLDNWPDVPNATDSDRLRYEIYCCYVFNLLERVWLFSKDDYSDEGSVANEILHVPEIIADHKRWWLSDKANQNGYTRSFQSYVDRVIADLGEGE